MMNRASGWRSISAVPASTLSRTGRHQSHSIPDNLVALFGAVGAWNCSAGTVATHSRKLLLWLIVLPEDSFESCPISGIFWKREDFRMVDSQTIAELVSQIPMDTWNLLREIKQRRPAMMLSELIDHSKRVSQTPQRPERGPLTNEPFNPG